MKATLLGLTILAVIFGGIMGLVAFLAYAPEWLLIGIFAGVCSGVILSLARALGKDILDERSGRWPS